LAYPNYNIPFILSTDASKFGIGGILGQIQKGEERVIAYYSSKYSNAEMKLATTGKEFIAIYKSIKHFEP